MYAKLGFPLSATITKIAETKAMHQALQDALFVAIRLITDFMI
jgi:hypothetical protein